MGVILDFMGVILDFMGVILDYYITSLSPCQGLFKRIFLNNPQITPK